MLAASIASMLAQAHAQTLHSLTGPSYSQNFDGNGSLLPGGWGFGQGVAFASTTTSSTQSAGTTGTGILSGSSAGGAYHFTNGILGTDTDRSIGYLTSSSFSNNRDILFGFTNTTGQNISALTLSFDYEKYRSGFVTRDWAFFGSSSDTAWGSPIASGGHSYAADANTTTVFNPPLTVTKSVTIGSLAIAPGGTYYFRWNYSGGGTGSGAQALGLDNLLLTATLFGGIYYWDVNGAIAGIGGTGLWDAAALNWNPDLAGTGTPGAADANREVVFGGTGGNVTIGSGMAANAGISFTANGYTLTGSALTLGGAAPATITIANSTHTATISAPFAGTAGFQKSGAGKITLTAANTFTGGTTISAGTLEISSDLALGGSVSGVTLGGGTLRTTGSMTLGTSRTLTGSGSIDIAPATTLQIPGTTTVGAITLPNKGTLRLTGISPSVQSLDIQDASLVESGADGITLSGPLTSTNADGTATITATLHLGDSIRAFTIGNGLAATDLLISGAITSGTNGRLLKLGAGLLHLTGSNTGLLGGIQLGTSATSGGTLAVTGDNALGSTATFRIQNGTLRANAPASFPAGLALDFGGSSSGVSTFEGSAMTFSGPASFSGTDPHSITANTDITLGGGISGSSTAITVRGTGSFTVAAASSFTGDVIVDGGNLVLNAPLTASTRPTITLTNTGTLAGNIATGSAGPIIVTSGTISPGNSLDPAGTITATASSGLALDLRSGSMLALQIGGLALSSYDHFVINGGVQLAGALSLSFINAYTPVIGNSFTLIDNDAADPVIGTFTNLPEGSHIPVGATTFSIHYGGGDGNDVTLMTIPEPTSASLFLLSASLLTLRRIRRSRE